MAIQTVSISNKGSKVKGDSQAAWLRFQEVQGLHQLQADQPYQEGPAGWREGGVSWQVQGYSGSEIFFFCKAHLQWLIMSQSRLCTESALMSLQIGISSDKTKHSPSRQDHQQSQEVQKSRGGQSDPERGGGRVLEYSDYRLNELVIFYVTVRCNLSLVLSQC